MDKLLDDLFAKRASVREGALSSIVDGLKLNCRRQFAEKNFATLLYCCLNSFKKGSSIEIVLASRALGLLAITIGCGDNANELYMETLPVISQALKSKSEAVLLSVIECLAVVTFVGADSFEQTEASMKIIWDFIYSDPSETVVAKEHSAPVLSATILSWSLLLTTVNGWNLSHHSWKGANSYFLDLLEVDDQHVSMAACEAIALICEVGSLEKFASDTTIDIDGSSKKGKSMSNQELTAQELQEIVSNRAQVLLRQDSLHSAATKAVNGWNNISKDVLEILKDGYFCETTLKIGKHTLQLHSLSQLLQVDFVKRFLGRGFVPHMLENEFLHDVFNFTPRMQISGDDLYSSEREEVVVHLFVPESKQNDGEENEVRTHSPTRSAIRKAKTQLLKKQRALKVARDSPPH
ncbi:uncharacterized protein LOC127260526 [Andrographis paniculata]|uniref:uncharacterized protein LOC127260526 n=1 Tax=Andrographis paniculata TaxID=175694 RepID=UPI0021E8C98C|nr:uncharacterized protein LOC127260526 [Andrographis paniculata]XP_051144235.1 uncharacterized protein LOC127260526 [Andrographis paniculata]XP_051144236.1 uncharacterized protein LOC127260526 [Andrographis paniculata]XP_051144237.1 uncharacterized protein LOC127260526 [Andrographis paniculata]